MLSFWVRSVHLVGSLVCGVLLLGCAPRSPASIVAAAELPTLAATAEPFVVHTPTPTLADLPTLWPTQPHATLPPTPRLMTLEPTDIPSPTPTFVPTNTPTPTPTHTPLPTNTPFPTLPPTARAFPLPPANPSAPEADDDSGDSDPPPPTPIPLPPITFSQGPYVQADHVLLISVDGLRPDALSPERTPHIWQLAQNGVYSWQAQTHDNSLTVPSHASMFSGTLPEVHGIYWNEFDDDYANIGVPTIFTAVRDTGGQSLMVYGKEKLNHLLAPQAPTRPILMDEAFDEDIGARAAAEIGPQYRLMVVHLPQTDFAGHTYAWMSEPYLERVATADQVVGALLAALEGKGLRSATLVIVTSDHGGAGKQHIDDLPENRRIPLVINGPGVRRGHQLPDNLGITDVAATVLFTLGINAPDVWDGRPIADAFQ